MTEDAAAAGDNLLLQIAQHRNGGSAGTPDATEPVLEAQVSEADFDVGESVEVEYNILSLESEPFGNEADAPVTDMDNRMQPETDSCGYGSEAPVMDVCAPVQPECTPVADSAPKSRLLMVPAESPAGMPMAMLLEKALAARAAGDPQHTASWFLAALARGPEPALRADIVLDLCAVLKACGYCREALAVLVVEQEAGTDPGWCGRIRAELLRGESA